MPLAWWADRWGQWEPCAPDGPPGASVTSEGDAGDVNVTVVAPVEPASEPAPVPVIIDPQPSDLEERVRQLETSNQNTQAQLVEIRAEIDQRALVAHEHATDPVVSSLVDNLREIEAEEVAPKRKSGLLYRPLWGGGR